MTDRDTQFQYFAKLLYVDIYQRIEHDYGPMHHLIPKVQEAVELIIAQRAYDLVFHAFKDSPGEIEMAQWGGPTDEEVHTAVAGIPDLMQWPDSPIAE